MHPDRVEPPPERRSIEVDLLRSGSAR
jgi:hypothetical protein